MSERFWRTLARGGVIVVLVIAAFVATIGTVNAAPIRSWMGLTMVPYSPHSSCYRRVVYLHGKNPSTTACILEQKPLADNPSPDLGTASCSSNLHSPWLALYQDINYGGASICFVGTGFDNLYNYFIIWPFETWSDEVSSFDAGASGSMTTGTDGNGSVCYFYPGVNGSWIGSWCGNNSWNDAVEWIAITGL
jgi:hypothetical protein